jgi:3-deoxy-D-manno-octulosonic-acid transferase
MQNFKAIASDLVANRGAIQVQNAKELEQTLGEFLADPNLRSELGRNALKVVNENLGSIDRTVAMIVRHLPKDDVYVVASG